MSFSIFIFWNRHLFDDGNERTRRMLNLLFFKNQTNDIFANILLEISPDIFASVSVYQDLLGKSRITIKEHPDFMNQQMINQFKMMYHFVLIYY